MSTQTFQSLLRTFGTAIGSLMVGHVIAGHLIDSNLTELIIGAFFAIGSMVWGFFDKATSIEAWESLAKTAITAAGSLVVAFGWVKQATLDTYLALIPMLAPAILSYISRAKVKAQDTGKLIEHSTKPGILQKAVPKIPPVIPMIFFLLIIGVSQVHAQSPFKPLPKIAKSVSPFAHALAPVDSSMNAFRILSVAAAYAEPGNILMAGIGYGYQWLKWDNSTQKWLCKLSISPVAFAGGSVAPSTPASIMSIGIMGGIDNNLILAGPIYNFGTRQVGIALSIGINFNN